MKNRLLNLLALGSLLLGQFSAAVEHTPSLALASLSSQEGIHVLNSDLSGVTLALDVSEYSIDPVTIDEQNFSKIILQNSDKGGNPGSPQIPFLSGLIGVPADGEISLKYTVTSSVILSGSYTLLPEPHLIPAEDDFTPAQEVFDPDLFVYAQDNWFPSEPVQLGESAWIREQRVVSVAFYPFQYNPVQHALRWNPHLQAEITFTGENFSSLVQTSAFETLFSQTLLNYQTARAFRTSISSANLAPAQVTYDSLGPRFDLAVNQNGIYRITYSALQAAGMDVDNINPQTFHLYSQGEDIAIDVFGEGDGSFDPGDYITFYGEKFRGDLLAERYQAMMDPGNGQAANNWFWLCATDACDLAGALEQYTDTNIYSLTVGGEIGPRMNSINGTPGGAAIPDVYTTTVRAEQYNYWWAFDFQSEDVWFWNQIIRLTSTLPYTTTYSINLPNVAPGFPATLHAEVASRNSTSGYPDHHTRFRLNAGNAVLNEAYWDGQNRYAFTANIPADNLLEGTNNLLFTMLPDVSPGTTRMYFDFFEITYTRQFVAVADELAFDRFTPGTWKYQISGLTSPGAEVYNITNPLLPVRVLNPVISGSGPYTASFQVTDGAKASYFVKGTGNFLAPTSITQYQPPNFAAMPEADYIFITHENFIPSLQPLAAYRASQGFSVAMIDVDDLYHEFNYGIYHSIAIKNFLAYTFANWETPPTNVILVGNGNWNFKHYGAPTEPYSNPPPVYMPPNLAYIDPWQGQTDSANLLATLVGDDVLPDLYISRLPVSTSAEVDNYVTKILNYESQPVADWQRNITFVTDNIPDAAGDFIQLAEEIITSYVDPTPSFTATRIYENDYGCTIANSPACDAVTQAILDTVNITGTLLINYIGHGANSRWSGESIFLGTDVASLNNAQQLPVVLSMTCLDGYWIYPHVDSLARMFVVSQNKGAAATFSPTGLGVATGHDELQRGFYDALFLNGQWRLGQATLQAKLRLFGTGANFDLIHTYTIFGDPALHFTTPYNATLTPETDAQSASSGETVTYTLNLTNPSIITDTYTLALLDNTWNVSIANPNLGPLAPGASIPFTVTVDIPPDALGNASDQVIVQATSNHDQAKTAQSTLLTTALTDGLIVTPSSQEAVSSPGAVLTYTYTLTNTLLDADVFTLTIQGADWNTTLSTPTLPVASAQSQTFQVYVEIPSSALGNDFDQVNIIAQSTNNPAHAAVVSAKTTAQTEGFTLSPPTLSQEGYTGTTLNYNLSLHNLLNSAQYYTIALTGQTWETVAPVTVGPANPGGSVNILVTVTVPLTATTGMTDTVTVTATYLTNPGLQASSTLTSTALELPPPDEFLIFLPLIIRP